MRISVYSIFEEATGRPLITGMRNSRTGKTSLYDLYLPRTGRSLWDVEQDCGRIKKVLLGAQELGLPIVTSGWKEHIRFFGLPRCRANYNAYDLQLGSPGVEDRQRARRAVATVLERMGDCKLREWQRVLADAAVVYQDMEDVGVLHGGVHRFPKWSQHTSTGRSKCGGFNLQGLDRSRPEYIRSPAGCDGDKLLLFDWVSADIRFAALLAGDEELEEAFRRDDPYTTLARRLGLPDQPDTRQECKIALLRGVNSMDVDSPVFRVYPELGSWVLRCRQSLSRADGFLDTFLGRRFRLRDEDDRLRVFNSCMQGSVAQAMQVAIRRIWERVEYGLLAEVHDSLVIQCSPERVAATIGLVAGVMSRPFEWLYSAGRVGCSPDFPLKVHVGDLWHGWRLCEVHRSGHIEQVFSVKSIEEQRTPLEPAASSPPEAEATIVAMASPVAGREAINRAFPVPGGV